MIPETSDEEGPDIPDEIRKIFAGRFTVDAPTAAKLLNMDGKTLRAHVKSGSITYVSLGAGTDRVRRHFGLSDLAGFIAGRRRRDQEHAATPRRRATPVAVGEAEEGFLAYAARVGEAKAGRKN